MKNPYNTQFLLAVLKSAESTLKDHPGQDFQLIFPLPGGDHFETEIRARYLPDFIAGLYRDLGESGEGV
jgi:hypothetical protein